MARKFDEWALHAYVDGEVAGEARAEIEAYLRSSPEDAARVAAWMRQREAMKRAFDGVLAEPVPPRLLGAVRFSRATGSNRAMAIAASLAMLAIGGLGGWFLAHRQASVAEASIASRALVAHEVYAAEVRHPVEVPASEKEHLQAWLSKRVGVPFKIPDLAAEGYELLGGRLLAAENRPAAQLMYEDANKQRITLFLTAFPGERETPLQIEVRGPLIACFWLDGALGFAVAGEADRERMMRLAKTIYDQLEG